MSDLPEKALARKAQTIGYLKSAGIKTIDHLPVIESEEEATLRTPAEIAERVLLLAAVNLVAFDTITGEACKTFLGKFELLDKLTPKERDLLDHPTPEKKNSETWKAEGVWTLLWALNLVPDLKFPDELCRLDDAQAVYPIQSLDKDPREFLTCISASRSKTEILDAADLYYRMDWACVNARVNGEKMEQLHPGVVYERHYALNWLINYMDQDWDDVSCDT